jgi:ubiquinone/menaquinone biosynthesis C-methylase UbiE
MLSKLSFGRKRHYSPQNRITRLWRKETWMISAREPWVPTLGAERVVEGVHFGWIMRDHFARYAFALDHCRGKTVLDIATGTGYGANRLKSGGAGHVVAGDCNHDALAYALACARSRYGADGITWLEADAHQLPLSSSFDVVISFETIEHLTDAPRFLAEVRRVLRPDGVFLVSTPLNIGGGYVSPHHEHEYTRDEFRQLLSEQFNSITLYGQSRVLQERVRIAGSLPDKMSKLSSLNWRLGMNMVRLFCALNKVPNSFLAWAAGYRDEFRSRIQPIDAHRPQSPWLSEDYFIMLGVCRGDNRDRW